MPAISVIVPVYKAEGTLARCVESILRQTFRDFELLLVDDGSPDNSPLACDSYADSDPRVKAIHKPNGGPGSARNRGMADSVGDWIAFVDADDWIADDYLEKLLGRAVRDGAEAAFCNYFDAAGGISAPRLVYKDDRVLEGEDVLRGLLLRFEVNSAMWGKLFKAEDVKPCRVDERLRIGEDLFFLLELYSRCGRRRTATIRESLYHYSRDGESLMNCGDGKLAQDRMLLGEYVRFADRTPGISVRSAGEHATFIVRTAWSIARDGGGDPETTRLLRRNFLRSLRFLYGHESRPVFLYLLRPSWGLGWYRTESAFRRWWRGTRRPNAAV
jgi:glycosyltransferase involved in cell wall biosynthesis